MTPLWSTRQTIKKPRTGDRGSMPLGGIFGQSMGGTGGGDEAYPLCVKLKMSPPASLAPFSFSGLGSIIPTAEGKAPLTEFGLYAVL